MTATQLSYFDAPTPPCTEPPNWRDIPPWCEDFRETKNGKRRYRSAGPLFYQDAQGVVWRKKHGLTWEYERWSE